MEAIDAGVAEVKADVEMTLLIKPLITEGGKIHRNFGDSTDNTEMNSVIKPGDKAFRTGGREDITVKNLTRVHDGKEPRIFGLEVRKHSKWFNVDIGSAANRFGDVISKLIRLFMTGGGSEANTFWELNMFHMAETTVGGKPDKMEGCAKAMVTNKFTIVIGWMVFSADGEDVRTVKNEVSSFGDTMVRRRGDAAIFDISVSSVEPEIASSTYGTEVNTFNNETMSVTSSSLMVFALHKDTNNACKTVGGRLHDEDRDAENRADINEMNTGRLTFSKATCVKDSLVKKFSITMNGITFKSLGDDERRLSKEFNAGAGNDFNRHGDVDNIKVRATMCSDGKAYNTD